MTSPLGGNCFFVRRSPRQGCSLRRCPHTPRNQNRYRGFLHANIIAPCCCVLRSRSQNLTLPSSLRNLGTGRNLTQTGSTPPGMEIHCQPEDSMVTSFDEDCVELGDVKDMRLEAEAVVNDVLFAVAEMHVSQSLDSALDVAYINVETRESNRYCLELTEAGLRVVGYAFDQVNEELSSQYHETVYSLLDTLSPGYREAFGNALLQRLERLKQNGQ
ncbi:GSK3-beta interaction protein isoform X1 [Lampris incognitus]|uniref:GSK3-beta interaction protein isoform X1 n=2 Tax=Lampris incognitus TaxID=2546036 RepID=UPI0024B4A418|nr:GSK3-beta interaction protein isoform X1 [Lampris incognitus]